AGGERPKTIRPQRLDNATAATAVSGEILVTGYRAPGGVVENATGILLRMNAQGADLRLRAFKGTTQLLDVFGSVTEGRVHRRQHGPRGRSLEDPHRRPNLDEASRCPGPYGRAPRRRRVLLRRGRIRPLAGALSIVRAARRGRVRPGSPCCRGSRSLC